jgi:superoxide dismutase, Fe-Mn family
MPTATASAVQKLHFPFPPLPFAEDALAPVISAETVQFHYGKHHRKYVDTMNQLLEKEPVQARTLEDVVRAASGKLFNNAAQAWNHDFYWHSLSPKAAAPSATLRKQLERDFGSYQAFVDKLAAAAVGQFGSGWAWLVQKDGTLDVWEHAYYIDYRNQRERYVQALIEQRLNWEFAEKNLLAK